MAALSKVMISLKDGQGELNNYLTSYRAEHIPESGTEKGQIFWSAPVAMWMMVMQKKVKGVPHAQVTFHAKDDCPCKMI